MNTNRVSIFSVARRLSTVLLALMFALVSSGIDRMGANASAPVYTPRAGDAPERDRPSREQRRQELISLIASSGDAAALAAASNLDKIDSHLQDLMIAQLRGGDVASEAQGAGLQAAGVQMVLVDVYLQGPLQGAQAQLQSLGMQVAATNEAFGGVIEGYLPVSSLLPAAGLQDTKGFISVTRPKRDTGSVTSQGDASHNGPAVRALGFNGAGVVVGIISDSMNQVGTKLAGSQGLGDLPGGVTVLLDDTDLSWVEDEGRAMAEIVYDTAPGISSFYFSSGTTAGAAAKATSINNLVTNGVDIIADDIAFWGEPFFQDGMIAQAVDSAYAAGVAYFVSSGNSARQSYEQTYRSLDLYWIGDDMNEPHDFDPTAGIDPYQVIATIQDGQCFDAVLQWDDPWGAGTHDLDWYLYNSVSEALLDSSSFNNDIGNGGSGIPMEWLYWCNTTGAPVTVDHEIDWWHDVGAGEPNPMNLKLKYLADIENGPTFSITQYDTASPTINPDAASAAGAMAVAAVRHNESGLNDPESFSSRGPVTRLFGPSGVRLGSPEVRQKPQVAGADCVITSSTYSGGLPFGGTAFCGTSAAAPSVAGVAALILSSYPSLSPAGLYAALANSQSTIDCTLAGNPDADCGYGFVLADQALDAAHLFADVPVPGKEWMEPWIIAFYQHGVTTGCNPSPLSYCPENQVTRAEMAVFLLRAKHGAGYAPPAADHFFLDVPVTGKEWMEPWIDQYYREGMTTGCGSGNYCPENNVTRAEMAVFVMRALNGAGWTPPPPTGVFGDVPVTHKEWMQPWIEAFYHAGITTGCGGGNYCPENNVTRAEMAVFLGRAYHFYP